MNLYLSIAIMLLLRCVGAIMDTLTDRTDVGYWPLHIINWLRRDVVILILYIEQAVRFDSASILLSIFLFFWRSILDCIISSMLSDFGFGQSCRESDVRQKGTALLFVSHNPSNPFANPLQTFAKFLSDALVGQNLRRSQGIVERFSNSAKF